MTLQRKRTERRCPDETLLAALTEGNLPDAVRASVVRHVAECRPCQETVASLTRLAHAPVATVDPAMLTNSRQDPEITDEVRAKKSLGIGAGNWVKHIFPTEALAKIREAGGNARRRHYDLTLPWEDSTRTLRRAAVVHTPMIEL